MGQSGGAAEPSTRQEAAGLCVFSLLAHEGGRGGGSEGQGRWDRLQGREVDRGDNQQLKCLHFCRYNHSSENNWLVFFRLPPCGRGRVLIGEPLSHSHKATGDISACVGTSLSFCFFPPPSPVPAVLDVVLQAAVHSIVQGNWFPAWFLVLKPGAVAAWYRLWRVVICLQS